MKRKGKINLYLAILNRGWLRREISSKIIPNMNNTEGVKLYWENPSKSWGEPICDARARIVRRFLAHDPKCDFLLMMDHDIIPLHNPAQLVYADKDIVGSPAKVRQRGQSLNWVAYVEHPGGNGYAPCDFSRVDSSIDLLSVDIVGTGCIMIKRRVLEKLEQPFIVEFNEYGECTYGTDFAFCRRAKKAGFEIYTTTRRVCEHVKEMGLLDITGYDDSDYRDASPGKYEIPWGDFAITQNDWTYIKGIIDEVKPKTILEFGAGLSSLLMSEITHVFCYETNSVVMDFIKTKMNSNQLHLNQWDGQDVKKIGKFGLCFVDGPLGKINGGMGREHSIRLASEHSDHVIIHDAGRDDETQWQNKYLRKDFRMISKSGNHQSRCQYWMRRCT
jgi:hypothetical protein